MRIGVFGAGGRMGRTVSEAVADDAELELVAAVDPNHVGEQVHGVTITDRMPKVDVVIDFTHVGAARENLLWAAENAVHAVVGTTGFDEQDHERFRSVFTDSNCVIAPNFAIGAVLMMRMAELAAPYFDTAEIIELHHNAKRDSPSGTAMLTAAKMAAAKPEWAPDPTEEEVVEGARGGEGPGGIHVHAVRMQGMVAHQEVILGTTGQTLVIRHDTTDRTSFMPGVLLAVKQVPSRPGVTVGLDALLEL
jgi:4-hydroxy-tetrahydrodipicolinate reductase